MEIEAEAQRLKIEQEKHRLRVPSFRLVCIFGFGIRSIRMPMDFRAFTDENHENSLCFNDDRNGDSCWAIQFPSRENLIEAVRALSKAKAGECVDIIGLQ